MQEKLSKLFFATAVVWMGWLLMTARGG